MTCSILSLDACPGAAWAWLLGFLPWWLPYVGWALLAILALWVLSKVKDVAGYPGVAGLVGLIAGLWLRGKVDAAVDEHVPANTPDALPTLGRSSQTPKGTAKVAPKPPTKRPPDPPRSLTEP